MCVGLSARVVRLQTDGTAIVDASGARRGNLRAAA